MHNSASVAIQTGLFILGEESNKVKGQFPVQRFLCIGNTQRSCSKKYFCPDFKKRCSRDAPFKGVLHLSFWLCLCPPGTFYGLFDQRQRNSVLRCFCPECPAFAPCSPPCVCSYGGEEGGGRGRKGEEGGGWGSLGGSQGGLNILPAPAAGDGVESCNWVVTCCVR